MTTAEERTVHRACHLCEAICGLEFRVRGDEILSIRGDADDPFSRGHICPKAVAIKDIHEDPNRVRTPLLREGDQWRAIGWDEAFALAGEKLAAIVAAHGDDAVGLYIGNPSVHNSGTLFNVPAVARALKTRNIFSATSVDQLPQQLVSHFMFGHQFLIPIPDIDHTQHLLILGGNPVASNGSMMTVPDVTKRLHAIKERGGKVVVIDPRRTETAEVASEHHFIRPGTDAALLMALINTVVAEKKVRIAWPERVSGLDEALRAIAHVTPDRAATATGIDAATIRRMAAEFADAPSAVCYGRLGTTLQSFGTLNQWLVQLLNLITGNLDREGGALPTTPLFPMTGPGTRPGQYAKWRTRVSGLPSFSGESPSAAMAEEILTPGTGQIRAMAVICGNPVLSTPNGRQLDRALESLDFMVAVDIFINETTRHAHLILPPASSLAHAHYDNVFNAFAIRNVARLNPPLWPRGSDERYDWEILGELGRAIATRLQREPVAARSTETIVGAVLSKAGGMTLDALAAHPHGIDLGPLKPSLLSRLETPDRKIQCAPAPVLADIERLNREVLDARPGSLTLIGRRHVRSNNSWMHFSHRLVKGKTRHQLLMHPSDMSARHIAEGSLVEVSSRTGTIRIAVEASESMMPGVASLPHGWGHDRPGSRLGLAHANPGASYNDLSDERRLDAVSGNAALNGTPVDIVPVAAG
ncbi:MAG: molybdopterin-dependent oxidoreductase [Betaproteobacteria bacterium]|nr:molybdopterin-dependent oxidoreductase [Betaproteobacteria bacterium]